MSYIEQYKAWISAEFPTSIFKADLDGPEGIPVLDVFAIPDADMPRFFEFKRCKLFQMKESARLPRVSILPHSVTKTQTYYPEIWAHSTNAHNTPIVIRGASNVGFRLFDNLNWTYAVPLTEIVNRWLNTGYQTSTRIIVDPPRVVEVIPCDPPEEALRASPDDCRLVPLAA